MAEEVVRRLTELADELGIRGGDKLYKAARRRGLEGVTTKLAQEAVKGDVGRQVLAPPPRSTGKSAAEEANQRLQPDLIDFSNNARFECCLQMCIRGRRAPYRWGARTLRQSMPPWALRPKI